MNQNLQPKEIKYSQGCPKDDGERRKRYRELLEKGEKLFQKEKFGSAKYHFDQAYQICPSEEIRQRIQLCEENAQRMSQAQALVSQGYQLEREKKLESALKVFQRSLEIWDNKEIQLVVARLRAKLPKPTLAPAYQAEAEHRYEEAIACYREVLELQDNPQVRDRLGICLVKKGAYAEAANILVSSSSQEPEVLYYTGYALARIGRYSEAIKRWEAIGENVPELARQREQLIEIAVSDLIARAAGEEGELEAAYQEAVNLLRCFPDHPLVSDCVRLISLEHLEHLWAGEKFEPMLQFLLSIEAERGESEEFLPFMLAKVYFRLAEGSAQYLTPAIAFWLTVIYNPKYQIPSRLQAESLSPTAAIEEQKQLIFDLEHKLEELVTEYKLSQGEESLKEVLIHWEMERQAIAFLYEAAKEEESLAEILCTPAFAERFGLSSLVLGRLRTIKPRWEQDERFWIVGASFSSARSSLLLLNQGRLKEALAALPAKGESGDDEFVDYCRQRLFLRLGIEKLRAGEVANLKKYFTQATPLIQRFKKYETEIVQLAQEIPFDSQRLISMDEVLQSLVRHIKSKQLLDIASYIMSYKANVLHGEGLITTQDAERICQKALELNPDNEFAKDGLREMELHYKIEDMAKALRKGNLKKAADIAASSQNEEIEETFFNLIDTILCEFESVFSSKEKKIAFLEELYKQCEKVDPEDPVLYDILDKMEAMEEEDHSS